MLDRGYPAIGDIEGQRRVFVIVDLELAVLAATRVVNGGSTRGVAVDLEHRTFDRRIGAIDLRVRGDVPGCLRLVANLILETNGISAAAKDVGLGDRDAVAVCPGHRSAQLILAGG